MNRLLVLPLLLSAVGTSLILLWWRRWRRTLVSGGPMVVVLLDGGLLRGQFFQFPRTPVWRIAWTAIGARDGAGQANWFFAGLSLRPDDGVFAISTTEFFAGGFDMRVTVHDMATGAVLLSRTDNGHPTTRWRGMDADAPPLLLAEQARLDDEWEKWRLVDPDVPRPIASAVFDDPFADGELVLVGWTAAGHALMRGQSRLEIRADVYDDPLVTELAPWWAVVGPVASDRWDWIARGHGIEPAVHVAVPQPPLVRDVALSGGQLRVDEVVQTSSALWPGVEAFAGPTG